MVLGNSGDRKLKVNILIAVLIQQGNFCFPTPLDSLLNNILKEANVSNSPRERFYIAKCLWKQEVK